MGAETFEDIGQGKDLNEAFTTATEESRHWNGHGGYTGTLAEKHDFVIIEAKPMKQDEAEKLASELIEKEDRRIDDKWGPAGAIRLEDATVDAEPVQRWLFFGWASS